jgi:hypothetical protein
MRLGSVGRDCGMVHSRERDPGQAALSTPMQLQFREDEI